LPVAQGNLGGLGVITGDENAEALLQEAVRNARRADSASLVTVCLSSLATAQRLSGQRESASTSLLEALKLLKDTRIPHIAVDCLTDAAGLLASDGHHQDAACLLGTADAITQRIGLKRFEYLQRLKGNLADQLRNELGPVQFDAAVERGTNLRLDLAISLAVKRLTEMSLERRIGDEIKR